MRRAVISVFALGFSVVALATSGPAHAGSFDGKWKQGALHEEFTVQQWLPGCGPAPVSANTGGGELVTISEEGDELSIVGGGRVFRTNQCYDPLPTLVRDSHTRDGSGRGWRTRCSTPAGDPRRSVINTLITVTSDTHVELAETGRYEITLKEGRCIADVKRTRSFDLTQPAAATTAPPAATTAKPKETAPEPRNCSTPGEPARLEVRPSRKILRTGESFAFQAVVRDGKGCSTNTETSWTVTPSADGKPRITVDSSGKVSVLADALEGAVDLVVAAAGKSAHVTIDVSSPAHYDAFLAQSGLNASGENDEAAVAILATGSLGGQDAAAEGNAIRRRNTFIAVVGGLAAILGVLAFIGWRRARKAARLERDAELRHEQKLHEAEERRREKAARHAAQVKAHEESVQRALSAAKTHDIAGQAMACPVCHREYPAGATFCADDGTQLVELSDDVMAAPGGSICPVCKRGFDAGVKRCPHDGEELVPYPIGAKAVQRASVKTRGKICPTCGGRFDGSAVFCGKDGTALVLLN